MIMCLLRIVLLGLSRSVYYCLLVCTIMMILRLLGLLLHMALLLFRFRHNIVSLLIVWLCLILRLRLIAESYCSPVVVSSVSSLSSASSDSPSSYHSFFLYNVHVASTRSASYYYCVYACFCVGIILLRFDSSVAIAYSAC